ncbi:MAG: hypothetical protein D6798_15075 [Deltaproteobacteria bacterium]|nr:MAG: hypothetical protein D6798_15075 [Deltaproteobacteria bacterium]
MEDIETRLAAGLGQRLPWAGLAFAVGFTCGGEALSRLIDANWGVGSLLGFAALQSFGMGMALTRPLRRRPPYHVSVTSEKAGPCRWLVVAASGGAPGQGSPAGRAIGWQRQAGRLERVFVLYTDNDRGRGFYEKVLAESIRHGLSPDVIAPVRLDPQARWDPDLVVPALDDIYRDAAEQGRDPTDVLLDYTGGSVSFTAAMTLVAARPGCRLAQIRPDRMTPKGQPDPDAGSTQMEVERGCELRRR